MNVHLEVALTRLYLRSKETLLCLKPTTNRSNTKKPQKFLKLLSTMFSVVNCCKLT